MHRMTTDITRREALRRAGWLLGGTITAPTLLAILAGCEREAATPAATRAATAPAPYTFRTLSAEQSSLVETISEAIIPATDTPGARAARVNEFVDAMLTDYYPEKERARFLAGLGRVDAGAQRVFGKRFRECTAEQQVAILREFDRVAYEEPGGRTAAGRQRGRTETRSPAVAAEKNPVTQQTPNEVSTGRGFGGGAVQASGAVTVDGKTDPEDVGREAFFRTMKELTLVGYYTSEIGATQELHVVPMGPYRADIPLSQVGRTWA